MGTPSQALMEYLGQSPEQLVEKKMELERKRLDALGAARNARTLKAAERKRAMEKRVYCLHPVDDYFAGRCRTLCGDVRHVDLVLSPSAVASVKKPLCERCVARLEAWKLYGGGKPLTYRRLNMFNAQEKLMDGETKTKREQALENALTVMSGHDEEREGKSFRVSPPASVLAMDPEYRELAVSMLIGLIQLETERREKSRAVAASQDEEAMDLWAKLDEERSLRRRALHVELIKMKLPKEVLAALKGA